MDCVDTLRNRLELSPNKNLLLSHIKNNIVNLNPPNEDADEWFECLRYCYIDNPQITPQLLMLRDNIWLEAKHTQNVRRFIQSYIPSL